MTRMSQMFALDRDEHRDVVKRYGVVHARSLAKIQNAISICGRLSASICGNQRYAR